MKYHLTTIRMVIIKNLQTINVGDGVEKKEYPLTLLVGFEMDAANMEKNMEVS